MKIRKDFVTNSSSANFLIETLLGLAPAAGVVMGTLAANMAQVAQSSPTPTQEVNVSGSSSDTQIIDGPEAVQWLVDNGYFNAETHAFTDSFWTWYDSSYSDPPDSSLMGICGDYDSEDRDHADFTNLVIITENMNVQATDHYHQEDNTSNNDSSDENEHHDDMETNEDNDTNEDTGVNEDAETSDTNDRDTEDQEVPGDQSTDKPGNDVDDTSQEPHRSHQPAADDTADSTSQPQEDQPEVADASDQTPEQGPSSNLIDHIREKLDDFLTASDRQLLDGQNVTMNVEIEGEHPQVLQIDVTDGDISLSDQPSTSPNFTLRFNESLLNNIKKLKGSDQDKGSKPSVGDLLRIQIESDNTQNKLLLQLVNNKLNQLVKEKKIDQLTASAIAKTIQGKLSSKHINDLMNMLGDFL